MTSQWIGGHTGGSLSYVPKRQVYIVRISGDSTKSFKTEKGARLYRRKRSNEKGITKNKYRYVDGYVEVQLQGDHIGKISKNDMDTFKKCIWSAHNGHKRWYMVHSGKKKQGIPPQIFHRLLHPEWSETDHINRDGLDNRRSNLRNGSGSVNVINQSKRKDNKSGKTGVSFEKSSQCWRVQWPENGKRPKKSFSVKKYGMEEAKELAIQFRVDVDVRLGITNGYSSDCEDKFDKYAEYPEQVVEQVNTLDKTNTSGINGVRFNGKAWTAAWSINGKRGSKSYSIRDHGDQAKELAIAKRLEMKPHRR